MGWWIDGVKKKNKIGIEQCGRRHSEAVTDMLKLTIWIYFNMPKIKGALFQKYSSQQVQKSAT